jgi:hypothetical protein
VVERTVTLNFVVRNGQKQRHYIELTWKVDGGEQIAEEIIILDADLEHEREHGIWDHWDNPEAA